MRKINCYTGDSKEFLYSIGNALHAENKSTYLSIEGELYAKYDEFDDNTTSLETLTPAWVQKTPENGVKIDCAHDMYSRERKDIATLWEYLKNVNGGKVFKCPLCGVRDVTDLDHYAPRSIFPEYSVHPRNLIPTCHECNLEKDNDWLTPAGHRIIFNAYFDHPLNILCVINSDIKIDKYGMPYVRVLQADVDKRPKGYGIMMRTLKTLGLFKLYCEHVNDLFKTEFIKLDAYLNNPMTRRSYSSLEECWQNRKAEYAACLHYPENVGEVNVLLYNALVNSPDLDVWLSQNYR